MLLEGSIDQLSSVCYKSKKLQVFGKNYLDEIGGVIFDFVFNRRKMLSYWTKTHINLKTFTSLLYILFMFSVSQTFWRKEGINVVV